MKFPACLECHRRRFLQRAMLGSAALFTAPGAFAEALIQTPRQTEGPFYPDHLPLDTDNDLLLINDRITPAVGEIAHVSGTIRDLKGNPVRGAVVEIWEADTNGNYIHSGSRGDGNKDGNFQGYGRFLTGSTGEYYFRTIKPTPYGPRTAHIHFAVNQGEHRMLTTELYVKGEKLNETDNILNRTPADLRHLLISDFKPIPGSETGELAAKFDVVLGVTPEDPKDDTGRMRRLDGQRVRNAGKGKGKERRPPIE